jgi:hypothetical protein
MTSPGPLIASFLKETLFPPHDDGMDHEPKLLEEVLLQPLNERGARRG